MKAVIILAGGKGERLNLGYNKLLYEIDNKPIYEYALDAFKGYKIYFVSNDIFPKGVVQVKAGETRFLSVYNALQVVEEDYILIHDCARYNIKKEVIDKCYTYDLFYVGVKEINTIRKGKETLNRNELIVCQTPQGGKTSILKEAYGLAYKEKRFDFTDDVSVVLNYFDIEPTVVEGSYDNIKITTKEDLPTIYKIGHSFDIHRLVENRPLVLGGITIPFEKGLLGHSDGDCLLHSISEAILGALALGDLGKFFPDTDKSTLNIDSKLILKDVLKMMDDLGFKINNLDCMIYAEKPKMAPFIYDLRKSISSLLNIDISLVSIKATTYEKLGLVGESLAIASDSTILLYK